MGASPIQRALTFPLLNLQNKKPKQLTKFLFANLYSYKMLLCVGMNKILYILLCLINGCQLENILLHGII